jgi:hypothetical protein
LQQLWNQTWSTPQLHVCTAQSAHSWEQGEWVESGNKSLKYTNGTIDKNQIKGCYGYWI